MQVTVRFFGQTLMYNEVRKQESFRKERTINMLNMLRNLRNAAFALCIFFSCGVLGSLELEKFTLSQALEYIFVSVAICAFIAVLEAVLRFSKALLIVYARRRRRRIRSLAVKRAPEKTRASVFAA